MTIEEIKIQFPDEWVLLANPLIQRNDTPRSSCGATWKR